MEVKLYQINMDRDEDGVCFMRSESLSRLQGTDQINSAIYDLVFAGDLPCNNLEDVYRIFNLDHPEGYTGRSLSVSDVVQILNSADGNPSFHYCDSFGFKEVAFDPELTQDAQAPKTIKVVLVQPGKLARPAEIDASLAGMQKAVQGSIQAYYPFDEQVCIVCNEEGKLSGLEANRRFGSDILVGTFFIAGEDGSEDFCSLNDEQIEKYTQQFKEPLVGQSENIRFGFLSL